MFKFWILHLPIIFSLTYENTNFHLSFEEQILTHLFCICDFLYPFICELFYNWLLLLRPTYLKWDTIMDYNPSSMQVSMSLQQFKQSRGSHPPSAWGASPVPNSLVLPWNRCALPNLSSINGIGEGPLACPSSGTSCPPVHAHRVDSSPFELEPLNWSLGDPKLLHLYFALLGLRYDDMANINT